MPNPMRFRRSLPLSLAALALGGLSACMHTDKDDATQSLTVTVKSKAPAFTSSASGTYGSGAAKPATIISVLAGSTFPSTRSRIRR